MTESLKGKGLPNLAEEVRASAEAPQAGSEETFGSSSRNEPPQAGRHRGASGAVQRGSRVPPSLPPGKRELELVPTAAMKRRDAPFANSIARSLSMADLEKMDVDIRVHSNDVANEYELLVLSNLLERIGIIPDMQQAVLLDIAWCCKDVGATAQSTIIGNCASGERKRSEIVGLIKEASTLRRVCAYFAKLIWNLMLINNEPPTNWASKGFKFEHRFAAFDFFHGVLNAGALNPEGGLLRDPSNEEIVANTANKEVNLRRAIFSRGIKSSNLGEVTGADIGIIPENSFKNN